MALWEQIKQKHENRKQNVAASNTDPNLLYNLLTQDKVKTVRTCKMGDTVTVFLPTIYTGAYITKATYKWTSSSAKIGSKTIEQVAPCKQNVLPPKWTFVAPDSVGEYAVFFRASYEYSAATENGTIFGGYPTSSGIHGYQDESSVYGQLIVE